MINNKNNKNRKQTAAKIFKIYVNSKFNLVAVG